MAAVRMSLLALAIVVARASVSQAAPAPVRKADRAERQHPIARYRQRLAPQGAVVMELTRMPNGRWCFRCWLPPARIGVGLEMRDFSDDADGREAVRKVAERVE